MGALQVLDEALLVVGLGARQDAVRGDAHCLRDGLQMVVEVVIAIEIETKCLARRTKSPNQQMQAEICRAYVPERIKSICAA